MGTYSDELYVLITRPYAAYCSNVNIIDCHSGISSMMLFSLMLHTPNYWESVTTMKHSQLRRLIQEVLKPAELYSESAEELLVLTAASESLGGEYIYQVSGPARGMFQMEPATEKDILLNYVYYNDNLRSAVSEWVEFPSQGVLKYKQRDPLTYNLAYQVLMCRIHYRRDKFALPAKTDIEGMASVWKRVYNTYQGKGTAKEAISKYKGYVG